MRNAWEVTGLRSRSSKPQRQAFPSLTDQQGPLDPCEVATPMHAQPLRLCNVDQVTVLVTYTLIYKIQPSQWIDLLPLLQALPRWAKSAALFFAASADLSVQGVAREEVVHCHHSALQSTLCSKSTKIALFHASRLSM